MENFLRIDDIKRGLGRSRSAIYRDINNHLLTQPISLGERSVGWPEYEISVIQAARIAGKSHPEIRTLVHELMADRVSHYESLAKGVSHD